MTLEVLIITLDEGINNIPAMLLEPREGIGYLVSWQHSDGKEQDVPNELQRPDVEVHHLAGRGISRNRNNCLRHASADVCLIADDDCQYTHEQLQAVIDTFVQHPDVDIATFRYSSENNSKIYPTQSINLATLPKGYYVSSIEIAFKRESVQGKFWFNELFGYGAPLSCGEEELLVLTAKQQGLKCQFFPIDIVRHDDITNTINNISKSSMLMGRGAYTYIAHPLSFIARIPLNSFRLKKKYRVPFWHSVKNMLAGVRYYNKHRHDKQSYQ